MRNSPNSRWRLDATLREIVAGLQTNWTLHIVVAVVSAAIVAFVSFTDSKAVVDAVTYERERTEAGQYAFVVKNADPNGGSVLDAPSCVGLNRNPAVLASGGLTYIGLGELTTQPGTPFRVYAGVGQIRAALDPADRVGGGSGISATLAHQLGVPDGSRARILAFDRTVSDIDASPQPVSTRWFNPNSRNEFADVLWIVSKPSERVDECWVEFTPHAAHAGRAILRSTFSGQAALSVVDVLPSDEQQLSPVALFDRRSTNGLYLPIGVLLAAPTCLVMWFNRSRSALYRTLGAGRFRVATIALAESSWVLISATTAGISISRVALAQTTDSATVDSWPVALGNLLIVLGVAHGLIALTAVASSSGNLVSQLKDHV